VRLALPLFAAAGIPVLAAVNTLPSAQGSIAGPTSGQITSEPTDQDIVHGFLTLDFTDHHLTSRGINLQNKGLVTQQTLRLDWTLYHPAPLPPQDLGIDKVTLTTALFNDIDTHKSGVSPSNWNEIDPTIGPNMTFAHDWMVESPFIAFVSGSSSYQTCWAWDPRLTYHDHFLKSFSINPFIEFFDELQNKITVVTVPGKSHTSCYGVAGIDPTYAFTTVPLKIELPTYFNVPGENFYQRFDGSGGGTDIGLFSTTLKATVPIHALTTACGKWSVYAAVQYDYLNNPGLLDGNEAIGNPGRERNIVVFHTGITFQF